MTAAITPGPWEVARDSRWPGLFFIKGPSFNISFWTVATDITPEDARQRAVDAKAIAAVPAMIEALKWVRKIADENYERDPKLRAQGARTLRRIVDKADEALKLAGIEL